MTSCLTFSPRFGLGEIFSVIPDTTSWGGLYDDVPKGYEGRSLVRTPRRARATFHTFNQSMQLLPGESLPHQYGIYVLGFLIPHPAIYVGIASQDSSSPEGILKRVLKHRVKVTGSHTHGEPNRGGIHHPPRWGSFASLRHDRFVLSQSVDLLADVTLMTASLGAGADSRSSLTFYEGVLSRSGVVRDRLLLEVFGIDATEVFSLNTASSTGIRPDAPFVCFSGNDLQVP